MHLCPKFHTLCLVLTSLQRRRSPTRTWASVCSTKRRIAISLRNQPSSRHFRRSLAGWDNRKRSLRGIYPRGRFRIQSTSHLCVSTEFSSTHRLEQYRSKAPRKPAFNGPPCNVTDTLHRTGILSLIILRSAGQQPRGFDVSRNCRSLFYS
jgi:hypothetical protein